MRAEDGVAQAMLRRLEGLRLNSVRQENSLACFSFGEDSATDRFVLCLEDGWRLEDGRRVILGSTDWFSAPDHDPGSGSAFRETGVGSRLHWALGRWLQCPVDSEAPALLLFNRNDALVAGRALALANGDCRLTMGDGTTLCGYRLSASGCPWALREAEGGAWVCRMAPLRRSAARGGAPGSEEGGRGAEQRGINGGRL